MTRLIYNNWFTICITKLSPNVMVMKNQVEIIIFQRFTKKCTVITLCMLLIASDNIYPCVFFINERHKILLELDC